MDNQRDRPANWITVRCRLICIASSGWTRSRPRLRLHTAPASVSLSLTWRTCVYTCTHLYIIHIFARTPFFLSLSVHTNSRYSLLRSNRPRFILLVRERGTEYLRDTETDSLQLYWPPPLLHLLLPLSSPGCRTAGWVLRLTAAPTANQSAALPAPVIGFPRFSQLFLKSRATLFFPVLAPLSFDPIVRARVASRIADSARGTIGRWMKDDSAVDSLSSDAPIALFRCEGSLERLKKLNCAFIVDYLGSCLNVSRKQPARLLEYSVTSTTIHL